jgi:magnesium-transporting ATPase (P-type)
MEQTSGPRIPWHTLSVEECFQRLRAGPAGLSREEAARRLREWGPNELEPPRRISPLAILLAQFRNILVLILLAATALSIVLGHGTEAVVIMIIVFFSVLLGFVQEYRAERALEALRRMGRADGHRPPGGRGGADPRAGAGAGGRSGPPRRGSGCRRTCG